MDELKLQTRYAQSLFDLAKEGGIISEIFDDMSLIDSVCKENHEFEVVLKNPTIKPLKKKEILIGLFGGVCNELTVKFLSLVVSKRRDIYLQAISEMYIELYNKYNNIKTATIEVASALDEQTKEMVSNKIASQLACTVKLKQNVKPSLLGGFCLNIEGKQYDASFIRKLNDIKKEITKQL